eukprot:gene14260-15747_t
MAGRFVRASKFRHVFGSAAKKADCFDALRITKSPIENYFIAINSKFVALCIDAGGGGAFVVLPIDKTGRQDVNSPRVCAHEQDVLDLAWNPFQDEIIASSSEDGTIKIWQIPDTGLLTNLTTPLLTFDYHQKRCISVQWHPVASNILMSISQDPSIVIWNLDDGSAVVEIDCHPDIIYNADWSFNGDKIVTSCKDKKIRIIDARSGNVLVEGMGHEGAKPQRVLFTDFDRLFSTGFSRMSERQYAVWDQKDLSKSLNMEQLDNANGTLIPFYDRDTNMMYICGRGDSNIKYFELVKEEPGIYFLGVFQSNASARSLNCLPKLAVNVNQNEVMRFFKVQAKGLIEPISFTVPRKSDLFQDDIFPDTPGNEPALSAEQWASGQSAEPIFMSMKAGFKEKDKPKIKGLASKGLKGLKPKSQASSVPASAPTPAASSKPAAEEQPSKPAPEAKETIKHSPPSHSQHAPSHTTSHAPSHTVASSAPAVDNAVIKTLQEQVKKLQEELSSAKHELKEMKECVKKTDERVTVLESLVQEETESEGEGEK